MNIHIGCEHKIGKSWSLESAKKWISENKDKIKKTIKYTEIIYLKNLFENVGKEQK
jgi:hypothetical protein